MARRDTHFGSIANTVLQNKYLIGRSWKQLIEDLIESIVNYNQITRSLGIPKSTLSYWLKDVSLSKRVQKEILARSQKIWAKNITEYNKKRSKLIELEWIRFRKEKREGIPEKTDIRRGKATSDHCFGPLLIGFRC